MSINKDKIISQLKGWMIEISHKVTVDEFVDYVYYSGIIIACLTIFISLIMIIIFAFKKSFNIKYIYSIITALAIMSLFTLMKKLFSNQYSFEIIKLYTLIIFFSIILISILAIINHFFGKKKDKIQPIEFNKYKDHLLVECNYCHKQYKEKDMVTKKEKDSNQICKYCAKEKENS